MNAWEGQFLSELARTGNWSGACRYVGISRSVPYEVAENHPDFRVSCDVALAIADDAIREEIRSRAIEGWKEPVYQQGKLVGTILKKSDACLLALAKARCSEFRDRLEMSVTFRARVREIAKKAGLNEDELLETASRIARGEELP